MALLKCNSNYGYTYPDDFCLLVEVDEEQTEFTVDKGWIAGAFFLGLFLGAGLVFLCAKPFLDSWEKKKFFCLKLEGQRQDEEQMLEKGGKVDYVEAKSTNGWIDHEGGKKIPTPVIIKGKKGGLLKNKRFWRKEKSDIVDSDKAPDEEIDPALSSGMVDIMTQTNSSSAEVEMADQDMSSLLAIERSLDEEKDTLLLRTLALLLKKKMEKRTITKQFYADFTKKCEEEMKDLNKMIAREKEDAEEKVKKDPKVNKNPQILETEMEKLQTHYSNKQHKLHKDYKNEMRLNLLRSSGMSEAEVDDLMEKLMKNMAKVDERIGLEQARQRRSLEQRLAKRRQAVEYQEVEEKEAQGGVEDRVDVLKNILTNHLEDHSSMLESGQDEIMNEYANDLENIRHYHRKDFVMKEFGGLYLEKTDSLKKTRTASFAKLNKKQEKEKATVLQMAEKSNPAEFLKVYHDLMVKHHMEQEALNGELDQKEVQEFHKLRQQVAKAEDKAMEAETEKVVEKLENRTNISPNDVSKIIKLHKQQMAQCDARRIKEKQAMMARLEEKLNQRLTAADEAEARDHKEQETLKEEQMATMNKVLASNMDLTDLAKERVLREHEQNMQAMSNQLMRSKVRQQKSLEIKLNQRKAKLTELKKKQEEAERSSQFKDGKQKEDTTAILAAQIAKEEEDFEEARKAAVADLRRKLAEETNQALKAQDEEIGLLIGRLQVGQARRKAIIERQDATLKQLQLKSLQDEMEKKVGSGESMPASVTDQIIQQHYQQVSHANEQIQRHREEQQQMIMAKLKRKKTDLENEIQEQLEEDAQVEYTEQQQRGAGYASLALMQAFLEQRHEKSMADLQTEMNAELEKAKSELNMQMELELRKELGAQRQDLMAKLAAVSKLPKGDLHDAMNAASKGSYESKNAQRLAKDLRNEVDRARSSMDYTDNRREDLAYERANTDLSVKANRPSLRKKSAGRPAAREAFGISEDEDEGY